MKMTVSRQIKNVVTCPEWSFYYNRIGTEASKVKSVWICLWSKVLKVHKNGNCYYFQFYRFNWAIHPYTNRNKLLEFMATHGSCKILASYLYSDKCRCWTNYPWNMCSGMFSKQHCHCIVRNDAAWLTARTSTSDSTGFTPCNVTHQI